MNNCKLPELEQDLPTSRQNSRMSSRLSGKRSSRSQFQQVVVDIPFDIVRASANAIWNCCRSAQNRKMITSSEIPPYLIRLLERTGNEDIHFPVIGIINSCAVDVSWLLCGILYCGCNLYTEECNMTVVRLLVCHWFSLFLSLFSLFLLIDCFSKVHALRWTLVSCCPSNEEREKTLSDFSIENFFCGMYIIICSWFQYLVWIPTNSNWGVS